MTSPPTEYPDSWKTGRAAQPTPPATPSEAIALAVDAYVASLSDSDFSALVARTRGA